MEIQTSEKIAGVVIGLAAFLNVFKFLYSWIKDTFSKKPKTDGSNVTVNVNSHLTPESFKESDRYFLYFLLEQGKILRAMHDMRSDILREQMDYFNKHIVNFKILIFT